MKKLVFYNHFHNGDIHVSRSFVNFIVSKLKSKEIEFSYVHKNSKDLLSDNDLIKIEIFGLAR